MTRFLQRQDEDEEPAVHVTDREEALVTSLKVFIR